MEKYDNPFMEKLAQKKWKEGVPEKEMWLNAARDFGWFYANGIKGGLTPELSYLAAKNHFKEYGKTMMSFGEQVELFCPLDSLKPKGGGDE